MTLIANVVVLSATLVRSASKHQLDVRTSRVHPRVGRRDNTGKHFNVIYGCSRALSDAGDRCRLGYPAFMLSNPSRRACPVASIKAASRKDGPPAARCARAREMTGSRSTGLRLTHVCVSHQASDDGQSSSNVRWVRFAVFEMRSLPRLCPRRTPIGRSRRFVLSPHRRWWRRNPIRTYRFPQPPTP